MNNNKHHADLPEVFAEYLQVKGLSQSTREGIIKQTEAFIAWIQTQNTQAENTTYGDVLAYLEYFKKKGYKQNTVQIKIGCLKHYFDFLISHQIISNNPFMEIGIKGVKRRILYETLTNQELEHIYKTYAIVQTGSGSTKSKETYQRNKAILGLIIYQGLRTQEIIKLKLSDVNLREGKISIERGRRSNARTLSLVAHQLYDLMDYINQTRKIPLHTGVKETGFLFLSPDITHGTKNVIGRIWKRIKSQNPKIKNIKQLRASVIANWLKVYNMRKVQYLAGHRYVSSTEAYQLNNIDDLKDDINRYHPDL